MSYKDSKLAAVNSAKSTFLNAELTANTEEYILCTDGRYEIYQNYSDNRYSTVDNLKNIEIHPEQINITQESNSQYIPFRIPRYWDGIDLMNMLIQIRYENVKKQGQISNVVNVACNTEHITFGWLIDSNVTVEVGNIAFEVMATGINEKGHKYIWRTRPNGRLNILEGLNYDGIIEPSDEWYTSFVNMILVHVNEAKVYADAAKEYADSIDSELITTNVKNEVTNELNKTIDSALLDYYNKTEIDSFVNDLNVAINGIDSLANLSVEYDNTTGNLVFKDGDTEIATAVINSLSNLNVTYKVANGKGSLTFSNGENEIVSVELSSIDPSKEWADTFENKVMESVSGKLEQVKTEVSNSIDEVVSQVTTNKNVVNELKNTLDTDYYTAEEMDAALQDKASNADINKINNNIQAVESTANTNKNNLTALGDKIAAVEEKLEDVNTSPSLKYEATYDEEQIYTLWEIEGEGEEEVKSPVSSFKISGGGGGGSTSSSLKIEYITKTPLTITTNDKAVIKFNFSGTDSTGDSIMEGNSTWKLGNTVIAKGIVISGENEFDATKWITLGTQKLTLSVTDDAGSLVTKSWTIQKIDIRMESSFNDRLTYALGSIVFDYVPYGAISKDIHFILDGKELSKVTTTASGIPMGYTLPAQSHGAHLLETFITAELNGSTIESNHIFKDILWYDETSTVPVIGCSNVKFTAKQYDTTNITYTVYDPTTETPEVILAIDGKTVSTLILEDGNTHTWQYKSSTIGNHTLTITCGKTVKILIATVEKLDIELEPVTAGLVLDFNPVGLSNNDANRLWSNENVSMSVSDNFDWTNGGYQLDENGDQYFCIKAGTTATFDYKLFEDDAKRNGKEMKLVFKTTNVRKADTSFLRCIDGTNSKVGIVMNVHEAYIYAGSEELYLPYSEEDVIEFEFNITKATDDITMVRGYEDGIPSRPMIYGEGHNFTQSNPQIITIGSNDCDVYIYRFKVYNTALTSRGVLNNFIADARNAEEMVARYTRNQIYDENNMLTPETLAEKCPWLRVIKLDAPWFTNDKKDKVTGTTIQYIYKDGDPILDNWTAYNCQHSGQGTSSNEYGAAGRNMDLIMNKSGIDGVEPYIILGDGTTQVKKVSLTRDSVENAYFNIKVNIASSENANNALLQRRYNEFNPFVRTAKINDSKVKDTMEFYNCVVFVRENNPDISTHREFNNCDYNFYAIGNIGDSKKTDKTRVNDSKDKLECILEIMDYNLPLSEFPKGENALKILNEDNFDEEGTYGWRYRVESDDPEEDTAIIETINEKWREFYRFVVTSTDKEFHDNLKDYFVVDSALFYYLFTERYLMVDNRAKNSFWHYGKCDDGIYRWDLCSNYDDDTALGIDNVGKLVLTYGQEDVDYYVDGDPSSSYIYRAAESTFFCRLRDLFKTEMKAMFVNRESAGAWSSTNLINQFDAWQAQFPEELWRIDTERKYERTYKNGATRFLTEMANGTKKYQRRQFERNQELYMATKYFGTVATANQIMMRFNNPVNAVVPQDFTLYITPYSNMYIAIKYGNVTPTNFRAKAGVEYTIPYGISADTADITLIYGASFIQAIGDLSKCYVGDNDFSKASRLQKLIIGSDVEGYQNTYLTQLKFGNNKLLEYLDIQNTPNLKTTIDLSTCNNVEELYAYGSGATGVIFANGGKIKTAELPPIGSAVMKNLNNLSDLNIDSYDKINTLVIENCDTIDVKEIIESSPNVERVRIIGIDWELTNTDLLERIYRMSGKDNNGYNIAQSVLSGKVHVPVMREQLFNRYKTAWPNLEVTYDTMVQQYTVTFVNDDETVLDIQYVDKGGNAVDPITRADNPIPMPTKKSTIEKDFTFKSWSESLNGIFTDRKIKAVYSEKVREYTIKYVSKGITLQESKAPYGTTVYYTGDTPIYTAEESAYKYNLFKEWDKSGLVDGDKIVNAVFETCEYTSGCFDGKELSEMTQVEIYTIMKLGLENELFSIKDSLDFELGNDYSYDDVEQEEVISSPMVFDGTNYYDTEISIMDKDRDFTVAIDFELAVDNLINATLVQCYQYNGANGFRLWYSNEPKLNWGSDSLRPSMVNNREIIVLRHIAGSEKLTVYNSNLQGNEVTANALTAIRVPVFRSNLVFGAARADDGIYENYAKGTVHWCKVWYADLGETACKNIAQWPHQKLKMELAKFRSYYLADTESKRAPLTFLASNLLEVKKPYSNSGVNTGGWAESTLNTWLNTRLYGALSPLWKALIKPVKVLSTVGNKSSATSASSCYFYVPSLYEVDSSSSYDGYISETDSTISYLVNSNLRKRAKTSTPDVYESYLTRSPNIGFPNYIWSIDENGNTSGYSYPSYSDGVLLMFSLGV